MAKRRVNTKFLVILTTAVVGVGGGAVAWKTLGGNSPAKYVALAEKMSAQGNHEKAAQNYGAAFGAGGQKDLDLLMKQGEEWRKLAETDQVYWGRAIACWTKALEIDHNYVPALRVLTKFFDEQSRLGPIENRLSVLPRVREYAERLVTADPSDKTVAALVPMSVVKAWVYGTATDPQQLDAALAQLVTLQPQDAANAEIPTVLAQAYLKKYDEARQRSDRGGAEAAITEARKVLDAALNGQEKNVKLQVQAAQLYTMIGARWKAWGEQLRSNAYLENAASSKERASAAIAAARAAASLADESHAEELMTLVSAMAQNGDTAGGEALLSELAKAQPDNQGVRIAYARMLLGKPDTRAQAEELLRRPVSKKGKPWQVKRDEAMTLQALVGVQLEHAQEAVGADREAALAEVERTVARLQELAGGETPEVLRIRGQLQLGRNQQTEAVQTLVRARQLAQQQGQVDPQLLFTLANAYSQVRQTGEAKSVLLELLKSRPGIVPAQQMLAQLFLMENDADNAEPFVDRLEKAMPDNPEVKRQRMQIHLLRKQKDQARALFAGLPEGDTRAKLQKAQAGLAIEAYDDAVRLLEEVRRSEPKNDTAIRLLVGAHQLRKDPGSARRVLDEAVAADPSNVLLEAMRKQLSGASAEEMEAFTREAVEKNPDPFLREVQLATIASRENKPADALAHLKKAEQIKPEDRAVLEGLFMAYARDAQWDLATQYVEKLAKIDADKAGGAHYRFRLLMAQNKVADALALATDLSRKMPEFSQTWVTLAQAQHASNQFDAAVQSYERALQKQSDNLDALRGLIDCHYRQNRPTDAGRYIAQGRRTFPANPYFKELELRHELQFGDAEKAIAQLEELRKQQPESRIVWTNLAQAYTRAMSERRAKNDTAGVDRYVEQISKLAEDGLKKWPDERLFYAYLADVASIRGNLQAGVDALTRMAAHPTWKGKPDAPLMLSTYYATFGKLAAAEAAAQEAVSASNALVNGDDTAARRQLAGVQAAGGKVDEAIKTLDARPDSPVLTRVKLQLLVAAKRRDSAEKLAIDLLRKDPKASDVLNTLIAVYLDGGQYDQAMARVGEALAADPNNTGALYARGLIHLRKPTPDLEAAIADLRAVRDKDDKNADARYWLAEAYLAKNDVDSAMRELDGALRIVPGSKQVRMRLIQVCSSASPPRWMDAERAIRDGRALPEMAADPDLATAEVRMWIARRQADRAVEVARQAAGATKGHPEVVRAYFEALNAAGEYQRLLAETDKMVADANAAPWWVSVNRAIAKRRLDKKDEAMAEFERALGSKEVQENDGIATLVLNSLAEQVGVDEALSRVAPRAEGNPRWQLVQAYLYQSKRDWASAVATIEKTMAGLDKMDVNLRLSILRFAGTLYLSAQPKPMPDKAVEAFKRSLREHPNDTSTLNNLASVLTDYVEPARPQEALEYSQRAYDIMLKSGRVDPLILDTHGRVLTMVNRVPEGIVLLQDAADRMSIPDVYYHLAEAYMQQNAPEEAQKNLVKATAAIEVAKKDQRSLDPKMVRRVEELTAQAKQAIASKAQAGAQ